MRVHALVKLPQSERIDLGAVAFDGKGGAYAALGGAGFYVPTINQTA